MDASGRRGRDVSAMSDDCQIARSWDLARQSVQRIADVLVDEGIAGTRRPGAPPSAAPADHAPGSARAAPVQAAQRAWADALGAEVGEADLRTANAVLARAIRAVADVTSDQPGGEEITPNRRRRPVPTATRPLPARRSSAAGPP